MKTVPDGLACPQCHTEDAQITATVTAGPWERHFYKCPECDLRFAGSWSSTGEREPDYSRSYTSPSMSPSLA